MSRGSTGLAKVLFFYDSLDELINGYNKGRIDEDNTGIIDKYSLEQLWLMYVMKEKFGKTWNGEAWV